MAKRVPQERVGKGEAQRVKMLSVATHLLARHGLEGTSFQMIADSCKVSQSAVLYHFRNKPDLIEAVLRQILANNHGYIEGSASPTDDGLARIRKYFRQQLHWRTKHPEEAQIVLLLYFYAGFDPRFQKFYAAILQNARARLENYLYAAQRERMFTREVDVPLVGQLLHDAVLGALVNTVGDEAGSRSDTKVFKKWDRLLSDLLGI